VFGLFLWQYGTCYDSGYLWWNAFNEIDIEFSRWGNPSSDIGQFVAQPYDYPGNIERFDATFAPGEITSHAFHWSADQVVFRSWRGGPDDESPGTTIHAWTYTGPHIPRPEQPRVHLNLWRFNNPPASAQEVVLDGFRFVPEGGGTVGVPPPGSGLASGSWLAAARPNPSSASTRLGFTLPAETHVSLAVYDIGGRIVRELTRGVYPAGAHEVSWDGRDSGGRTLQPGVYLVRLDAGVRSETARVVRVR
jgi:hypothetical protein